MKMSWVGQTWATCPSTYYKKRNFFESVQKPMKMEFKTMKIDATIC